MTMKIIVTFFLIALFGVGFFHTAEAYVTIYSQFTHDTGVTTATNGGMVQRLGTGLTGVLSQMDVYAEFDAVAASSVYQIGLSSCTASDYATGCINVWSSTNDVNNTLWTIPATAVSETLYSAATTTSFTLDPTLYYFISFGVSSGNLSNRLHMRGSTNAASYAAGDSTHGSQSAVPLNDLYFNLSGQQTTEDISYTTIISPSNFATTTSATVTFKYFDHGAVNNNISSGYISFQDLGTGNTFQVNTSGQTGDQTITKTITLTLGHSYKWSPWLEGTNASFSGSTAIVFVGATTTTAQSNSTATSSPSGASELGQDVNIGEIPSCTSMINNNPILNVLSEKFPLSYVFDICTLIAELYTSTSTTQLSIPAPTFSFNGTKGTTSAFLVLDSTNENVTKYARLLRTPLIYLMWFLFSLKIPGIIMAAL